MGYVLLFWGPIRYPGFRHEVLCDYYIYNELKPTLAVHEKSFESDRERYEEIFGEKFVAAIVEKAKENGWQAWK